MAKYTYTDITEVQCRKAHIFENECILKKEGVTSLDVYDRIFHIIFKNIKSHIVFEDDRITTFHTPMTCTVEETPKEEYLKRTQTPSGLIEEYIKNMDNRPQILTCETPSSQESYEGFSREEKFKIGFSEE